MDLSTREGRRQQGERIKQAARDADLTLDDLARAIGCSRALIFQYASGASLAQTDRLQQIAQAVGKPLHWFFLEESANGGTNEQSTHPEAPSNSVQISAERSKHDSEREQFALERARAEQRRIRDDVAHLEALLAAAESPIDYRKVVECCQQLQPLLAIEVKEDPHKLAAVLLKQGNALIHLQEWGAGKEKLEQAAALYRRLNSPALERDCTQSLGHANLMLGRVEEALLHFEYVSASEDWTNRWQGTLSIGAANEMIGNYPAAISAFEKSLSIVDERSEEFRIEPSESGRSAGSPSSASEIPRLYVEANWANLELAFGDYAQALERSKRCIQIARRHGVQDQYIEALLTSGMAYLRLGQHRLATGEIQQALDMAILLGDKQHQSLGLSCIVLCETASRKADYAISHGKEALAIALRGNALRAEIMAQQALCEAYLVSAAPHEALYHAEQGLALAESSRLNTARAQFGVLKARALYAGGNAAESIKAAQTALAAADSLQIRPILLDCHYLLSRVAMASGDSAAAGWHAANAIGLAESMQLGHELWRGHALGALAMVPAKMKETARDVFARAIELLAGTRSWDDVYGDTLVMEDELAMDVCRHWLLYIMKHDGPEAARALAIEADWPPLIDWLESRTSDEGGKPDA